MLLTDLYQSINSIFDGSTSIITEVGRGWSPVEYDQERGQYRETKDTFPSYSLQRWNVKTWKYYSINLKHRKTTF